MTSFAAYADKVGYKNGSTGIARPVQTRLQDIYSVKDFGSTGTSNDTATVQRALTAANNAGGGLVIFPGGTVYTCDTLTVGSNTTMLGPGLVQLRTRGTFLFSISNQSNIIFDGMQMQGTAAGSSGQTPVGNERAVNVTGAGSSNISAHNCVFSLFLEYPFYAEIGSDVFFTSNRCNVCAYGPRFVNVPAGCCDGNIIDSTCTYTLNPTNIPQSVGIVAYSAGDIAGFSIAGNRVLKLGYAQAIVAHSVINAQIIGNHIVDSNYGIDCNPSTAAEFASNIVISNNILTFNGNLLLSTPQLGSLGIRVAAVSPSLGRNITISGNNVTGFNNGVTAASTDGGIIIAGTEGATITGNSIYNVGANGILIYGAEKGFVCANNTILHINQIGGQQRGIWCEGTGGAAAIGAISGNMITDLDGAFGTGIYRSVASPNLTITPSPNATYNVTTPLV